jgi:hypothetical protein
MKNKLLSIVFMAVMIIMVVGCAPNTIAQINTPVPNAQGEPSASNGQINVPGFAIQLNAPGVNPLVNTVDAYNHVAGILLGIWHGVISPVTLVFSFMNPHVQMYEVHNDGSQYNLGFLIGVAIIFTILGIFAGSRSRRN